jgi:acetolactate synthase-1/2/3 large subunit
MFGGMSKWTAQINDAERVPEYVSRAFYLAMSGRPGPVVLAIPEDMLREVAKPTFLAPAQKIEAHPGKPEIQKFHQLLSSSKSPLIILGGTGWSKEACSNLQIFAENNNIPVTCAFRCQHLFDNEHPLYAGDIGIGINPELSKRVKNADVLIAFGPRLGEITSGGYQLIKPPVIPQTLIHIHSGAEELGRVYQPALAINATPTTFSRALINMKSIKSNQSTSKARTQYLNWSQPKKTKDNINLGEIITWLSNNTPSNTIITNGAGNYSAWIHRYYRYRGLNTGLAPTSGSMGYGTPAAISAKKLYPKRLVVAFAGDGCFLMNGQELATAVQYKLPIIIIVINNSMYGTIRMHQEREYPERVFATNLSNPDFVALARAYGAFSKLVKRTEEFSVIFQQAIESKRPSLIEIKISPEIITPSTTLSNIRKTALKRSL